MPRKRVRQLAIMLVFTIAVSVGCAPQSNWVVYDISSKTTVDYEHYPTSQTVNNHLHSLGIKYPDLVHYEVVGKSVLGKPISALTITNFVAGEASTKPAIFVMAQQHAREPVGSQLALYWADTLLNSYGQDEIITHLLDTRTIYLMPQVNPDGNDIFLKDDQNIRGNLNPSDLDNDAKYDEDLREGLGINSFYRQLVYLKSNWVAGGEPFRDGWNISQDGKLENAHLMHSFGWVDRNGRAIRQRDKDGDGKKAEDFYHGVDINRNWDIAWLEGDARVNSYTYKGPAPWSEPETRAVRDFILARPNIVMALDIHSGVNMILYPWSMTNERPIDEPILQELARAGSALTLVPHTMSGDGLYLGYGTAKDWLYSQGMLALTLEVYSDSNVVSYQRIWPSNLYIIHTSTAQRFNPPPQDLKANSQRWEKYLTYLLATIPSFTAIDYKAINNDTVVVTFRNTGHLKPEYVQAKVNELTVVPHRTELDTYSFELPLRAGESLDLTLEIGSVVKITSRPLPPVSFRLEREGDQIKVSNGTTYSGPLPSSLFIFGYEAPLEPWGQDEWHITKG